SVSFCIALLLTMGISPTFNSLANKELDFSYLVDGYLIGGFLSLLIITSFTAGFYPALVLSSFQPVQVLYGRYKTKGRNLLTKGLIVVQFTLAMFLIIGTIAINSQLNFLFHANLGYDSQNLVRVEIPIRNTSESLPSLFKNELAGRPDIVSVAARNGGRSISGVRADGKMIEIENVKIDDRFLSTFRIPIVSGRNFSPDHPSDSLHSVIVNETFVRAAGWKTEDAVGRTVQFMDEAKREATVVGVIKDYHFLSLKEDIKPELLSMNPSFNFGEIWIRIDGVDVPGTLSRIRSTFVKLVPLFPYSYEFMNDINARNYESETKWRQIITIASALFMFISCIGLFGLVGLSVEHRTKEIGIRKILGAAISTIVGLISKEFALLVGVAFVVATPAAWYAISRWLELFAYRIDPGWWMFASGGILVVAIALAVVCMQAIKAAVASPVNSLKTE
ncbi:MAG TPA: FtsX-like permease family protein, partial [Chryseosolibacter sp.]